MNATADRAPRHAPRDAAREALRRERALLLERVACTRRASAALAGSVERSLACSVATCEAAAARRLWRTAPAPAAVPGAPPPAPADETTTLLLRVLADVDVAAAAVAARMPWLDEAAAVEQVLARALDCLARELPPAEVRAAAGALRALLRQLRPPAPAPSTDRFRPPLRRR